jgi:hypothetical protein
VDPPARSTWYLGPLADLALWQFGWVWLLVPLALSGDRHPRDYFAAWVALNVASFTHRQLTFLAVYLDRGLLAARPVRFGVAAIAVLAGFAGTMALVCTSPVGMPVLVGLGAVGAVWNGWHVLMQKYGLLRLYAARTTAAAPPWADRALLFGWLPLWLLAMVPLGAPLVRMYRPAAADVYGPAADLIAGVARWGLVPAIAAVVATSLIWAVSEHCANGATSTPRLFLAASVGLLGVAFFAFPPLKVYLALGFNHAIEYAGFVWGYERRRHATSGDPLLGRAVRSPVLAVGLVAPIAAVALGLEFADDLWLGRPLTLAGVRAEHWLYGWTVWSSFAHFWFDGFLWRLRDPAVRAVAVG